MQQKFCKKSFQNTFSLQNTFRPNSLAHDPALSVFQEERDELPTTVLCFHPYGKPSKLNKYGISSKDLVYNRFPPNKLSSPWSKFQKDMFYQMNDDFVLTFSYLTDSLEWPLYNATLNEGNNEVKIDANKNQRRKRDLVGHGFNNDIGDKDVGQFQAMANQDTLRQESYKNGSRRY